MRVEVSGECPEFILEAVNGTTVNVPEKKEAFCKTFGVRLKKLCKQKCWSQKELATKVDIRFQQLNKYESGLNPSPVLSWLMPWPKP